MTDATGLEWLRKRDMPWLGSAPYDAVVWGHRVALSRNVQGQPFPGQASRAQRMGLERRVQDALAAQDPSPAWQCLEDGAVPDGGLAMLAERGWCAPGTPREGRRIWLDRRERQAVIVNEDDGVRLVAAGPGLALAESWCALSATATHLSGGLSWASAERWGYLTARPEEAGTGLVTGVLLHLPGLVLSDRWAAAERAMAALHLRLAELPLTGPAGQLYWLQNAHCRGESAEATMDRVGRLAVELAGKEREARTCLVEQQRATVIDLVGRAYGLLCHARTMTAEEASTLLSAIALGVDLRLLRTVDQAGVRRMWQESRPGHLDQTGEATEGESRAHRLRAWLAAAAGGLA